MTIKEAIEKAIDGGYQCQKHLIGKKFPDGVDSVLLDTLFWQSLGKAMGWEKENVYHFIGGTLCEHCERGKPEWQQVWRRFIDHLAEGGTPESFFSQL